MMTTPEDRAAPIAIDTGTFRTLGHQLVDELAAFLESVRQRPVTRDEMLSGRADAYQREIDVQLGLLKPVAV